MQGSRSQPSATSLRLGDPGLAPTREPGTAEARFGASGKSHAAASADVPAEAAEVRSRGADASPPAGAPARSGRLWSPRGSATATRNSRPEPPAGGEEKLGTRASLAQLVTFAEIGPLPLPALPGARMDAFLRGFGSSWLPCPQARCSSVPASRRPGGRGAAPLPESVQTARFS